MKEILNEWREFLNEQDSAKYPGRAKTPGEKLVSRVKESGPPKIGLNVLMGDTTKLKLMNQLLY